MGSQDSAQPPRIGPFMKSQRRLPISPTSTQRSSDPRQRAVHLLVELERGRRTLDAVMERMEASGGLRDDRDRDLLNAILFGVLRWRWRRMRSSK